MIRSTLLLGAALAVAPVLPLAAQADLTDVEMAHVAVTANDSDIAYAHLALAFSDNPAIREFAETMIRDHSAVTARVVALARKLNVEAQDNPFSQSLRQDAARIRDELSRLRGAEFDRAYAANELRYHRAVNGVVADAFIPNIEHPEVKRAFEEALVIFRGHERHAERLTSEVVASAQ